MTVQVKDQSAFHRVFKNGASRRDPAWRDVGKCSHLVEYAAFSKALRALADDPMLVLSNSVADVEPPIGIEPITYALRMRCSAWLS
jgi:hypothetical protein